MPRQTENIRNAEADNQPDVNLSYNELINEFMSENCLPLLEDSDVTAKTLADKTGMGERAVRYALQKKVDAGEYKIIYKRTDKGIRIATYIKA